MNISKIRNEIVNLTDHSVEEYKRELLEILNSYHEKYSTHAMSEHGLTLQGEKAMLKSIIGFITRN